VHHIETTTDSSIPAPSRPAVPYLCEVIGPPGLRPSRRNVVRARGGRAIGRSHDLGELPSLLLAYSQIVDLTLYASYTGKVTVADVDDPHNMPWTGMVAPSMSW
jgi:hypothetical protein